MKWFDVDKQGLSQLLEEKGKAFAVCELLQNAWDADDTSEVFVEMNPLPNSPFVELVVSDDSPNGFADLTHAFTLFAPSTKKGDPTKRGRFNLGEKLVLALCRKATIISTSGGYEFNDSGRKTLRRKREKGSEFRGELRMTRGELAECIRVMKMMQVPEGITTTILAGDAGEDGQFIMERRTPLHTFEQTLQTLQGDTLRTTYRKTQVDVLEPAIPGEGWVYEMGIPVCKTNMRWDVDIHQRVPMNLERDQADWYFLYKLRPAVLNVMVEELTEEDATEDWVSEALAHGDCSDEAAKAVITKRFGDKVVSYDPTDPEAGRTAVAKGYTLLHGGQLSKDAWATVRRSGAVASSGRLFPTGKVTTSPDGKPPLPRDKWPEGAENVIAYAKALAKDALNIESEISVRLFDDIPGAVAAYGNRDLVLSLRRLGKRWFTEFPANREKVDELLIHEFAHEYESNHLSQEYHEAITKIAARLITCWVEGWGHARRFLQRMKETV